MSVTHLMARAARSVVTVVVFILALHLLLTAHGQTDNTVTCDVPSVEPFANTSVTCHFPQNFSQTRRLVTVSFYKEAQYTASNENEILDCWWRSGRMDCDVQPGYMFSGVKSHELTFEIPRVTTKHIGGYVCKFSNMNPNDAKPCELKIKLEGKTMCDVPSVPLNSPTSLTCYFPDDLSKNTADFSVYHHSTRSDPANVMSCKRMGDHRFCSIIRGYEFDYTVTNHLTVGIPKAQEDQEGSYSCHFSSSEPVHNENCSLTFKTVTSFCNISSVVETEPASLTCTFNVDVNTTKENFSLVRIGGADSKDVDIVTCTWLKDQLKCTTAPGYEVNNLVTDRLVIRVPRASRDHTGTYACRVTGSKANGFHSCEFIPKPVTSFCNISSIKETKPASLTCTFNVDVHSTKSNLSLVRLGGDESKDNVYISVDIVTCTWLQDQLKCTTAPGYEVNNLVTDRLVIRVLRASRDHTGTYACHVTGSSMDGFKSCDFLLIPDVPAVVLTVAIAVLVFIPVSLVIIFLVFKCKQWKEVDKVVEEISLLSKEEMETSGESEEEFWEKWVEAAFPNLDTDFYFLPPVPVNLQPFRQTDESNQTATTPVQDSDVRDDAAMQRVLLCLEKMFKQNREVLVGVSHFSFDYYLHDSRYADVIGKLLLPTRHHPDLRQKWKQGDIDLLLIHRQHGLVICIISDFDGRDKNNLQEAMSQLDRAERILSHLVSDVAPRLFPTKTIAFPNLTFDDLQWILQCDFELTKRLGECLRQWDPYSIADACLCRDQLSDSKTPRDVSSHVRKNVRQWWDHVTQLGVVAHMTAGVYKKLVARLCGPATTVSVPCTCPPRVSVKTLGQAVWWTGECYTAVITLFPEQVHLLHTAPPTLFVTGPPGTGKTVVLLLMAIQWLRCGHHVYVVSTWRGSRAACSMLYHLLLQTVNTQQSAGVSLGQPHLLLYHLDGGKDVEKVVNDLSQAASAGSLYIIADEVVSPYWLEFFCSKLLTQVPRLHLWAASCFHRVAPDGWQVEYLTRPLRSPPVVVREVEQYVSIRRERDVLSYSKRGVSDHTDGPPVRRLYHHRGQGHSGDYPGDCVTCGREVASFLHSLRVGVTESGTATSATVTSSSGGTTPPCLQWKDVLVLDSGDFSDNSGVVKGLKKERIPVRVMKDDNNNKDDIEDVATARSDVVWVTEGHYVRGLERKVVVCLQSFKSDRYSSDRLDLMSCCTSQLVIVSPDYDQD